MKITRFNVKIKNNTFYFKSKEHSDMFARFLSQFENQDVFLEISEHKSKRSEQQNRYYWLYLSIIERDCGNTIDELHTYFKGKYLTKEISEVYGDKCRITKSTTDLTKGEFVEYLVNISECTGIDLPDTTLFFGYSYHK